MKKQKNQPSLLRFRTIITQVAATVKDDLAPLFPDFLNVFIMP